MTAPPFTVRPLRWEDFPDLRDTYYELYEERDSGEPIGITLFGPRPSLSDEVGWFAGEFRRVLDGEKVAWVAEADGHAVGSCNIGGAGAGPTSEQSHLGELGILVRRSHRGKGVGSALLERSLADARTRFELVYLSVFSVNVRALELYRKFGFVPCGHFPRAVKRGDRYYDIDRMVLDFRTMPSKTEANR